MAESPQRQTELIALGWTLTAVAAVLTGFRYIVRLRRVGGLQLDDLLHGAAMLATFAYMGVDTAQIRQPYYSKADYVSYERLAVTSGMLAFVVVLYFVKFAFLAMYRHIFRVSARFMLWWKLACAFTVLCFLAAFFSYFWICGSPFQTFHPQYCSAVSASEHMVLEIMVLVCLLNALSSLIVMALPLSMLVRLHVPTADKCGLAAIFLLAFVDVILDILRTITTLKDIGTVLEPLSDIEPAVAVMVSALAALGPVLRRDHHQQYDSARSRSTSNSKSPYHLGRGGRGLARRIPEYADDKSFEGIEALPRMRTVGAMASPLELDPLRANFATRVFVDPRTDKSLPDIPAAHLSHLTRRTEIRVDVTSRYNMSSW